MFGKLTMTFWILSFENVFTVKKDKTGLVTELQSYTQLCAHASIVSAWLWGMVDPGCRWMSRLISSRGHWSSIIHEINAEDSTRLDTVQPYPPEALHLHPSSSIFLRRLFSLHSNSFLLRMSCESCEHENWECSPQGDDSQWEAVRRTP